MAKLLAQVFKDSLETQYASGLTPVLSGAKLNTAVNFLPVGNSTSAATSSISYNIQRMKRVKAKTVGDRTANLGTDLVAQLNQADEASWDTVVTTPSKKRQILLKTAPFEMVEATLDASPYERTIAQMVNARQAEAEEIAEQDLFTAAKANTFSTLDLSNEAGIKASYETIKLLSNKVELLVDDFKAYSNTQFILIHPTVLNAIASIAGRDYMPHAGVLENGMPYDGMLNGIPYARSRILNTLTDGAITKTAGVIVYDLEAYAYTSPEATITWISNQQHLDTWLNGLTYHEVHTVIDSARIFGATFDATSKVATSKKVSA